MITVSQYEYIRTAHRVYDKTIKQISRETGHSRNTIRKALRDEYGTYKKRARQPYPVLGSYIEIIDNWLKDDCDRPKKQRHTATRIFNRLKAEQDFTGGGSTVRRYVREAKQRLGHGKSKAFIPLDLQNNGEAEVDWGTAHAVIDGEMVKLKFFCLRSKYSGKHFVRLYPCERQQAFFDAHIKAFDYFGGIFPILIYDNLTTAVRKVLKGKKRIEQEDFVKFHAYYNFSPRFCNVASGHEKGGVEGAIGFTRRNYMVPIPHAKSLDALNEKILKECIAYGDHRIANRTESVNALFEKEMEKLFTLPGKEYSNIRPHDAKSDKYSTVIVDKNRYSVPTRYAQLKVNILQYTERVEIYFEHKKIACHKRLYNNNQWSLNPDHYLELIQMRPQAFDSAKPITQWREKWPECLEKLLSRFCEKQGKTDGTKDFISVLMFYRNHSATDIHKAVEKAIESNLSSSDGVKSLLLYSSSDNVESQPLKQWSSLPEADTSVYAELGGLQ
jgi:transposase